VPRQQVANYLNAFAQAKSLTHIVIPDADHALSQQNWYRQGVNVLIEWCSKEWAVKIESNAVGTVLEQFHE
jgi:hypothetical protein